MKLTSGVLFFAIFISSRGENNLRCFPVTKEKKITKPSNRVDQDTAETNLFAPLDENYLYEPNTNRDQLDGTSVQFGQESPNGQIETPNYIARPEYDFGYSVNDPITGDQKSHREVKRDDVVHGTYSLIEPDGSRRTVVYTADDINGFNAVVYKDSPILVQDGFYYDQDHAATSDLIRGNLNTIPRESEFGKKISKERIPPTSNDSPKYRPSLEVTPIIVPNVSSDVVVGNGVNSVPTDLTRKPVFSQSFITELTKLNSKINSVEPIETSYGHSTVQISDVTPTTIPEVSVGPLIITTSSPKPFEETFVKNPVNVVQSPNYNPVITPTPLYSIASHTDFRSSFGSGEFPLLAHISPSYSRRYARYFS